LPGVEDAAATRNLPLSGQGGQIIFYAEGRPARGPEDYAAANYNVVSPGYFRVLGIPLLRGRDLTEQDRIGAPGVVLISESMARRFWPHEDPLGKRLKLGANPNSRMPWLEIIGIVADVKQNGLESREGEVTMYTCYWQSPPPIAAFVVRGRSAVTGLASAMGETVRAIDKDQPLANIRTLDQIVARNFAQRRFSLWLLGIFAGVALVLAAGGIYGVMAYSVTQRTHEIGMRMALGAGRRDVLRLMVGQGVMLTGAGVVIGLCASFALTRLMEGLLFGVSATDPLTFVALALLLVMVALLACYLPARRATKVDPMIALRCE
jgi:putative ABC transport system permease protein